jgi:hypothetical protein
VPEPIPTQDRNADLARRRATMFATLVFNELVPVPSGMEASFGALRLWLDSWKGIGDIEAGARAIREERDVEAVVEDLLLLRSGARPSRDRLALAGRAGMLACASPHRRLPLVVLPGDAAVTPLEVRERTLTPAREFA